MGPGMLSVSRVASWRCRLCSPLNIIGVLLFISATGCGSSGSVGGGSVAGTPGFSLLASAASINLNVGSTQTFTVYVQPINGFDSSVAVSLSGLPTGVSASPSSFSLQGNATQVVTLTAATTARTVSNATIDVAGSSGSLSSNTSMSLNVLGPPGFSISVPSTFSVIAGASQTATVSVTGINGFSGMVTINISGLPTGVTANPPTIYVDAGSSQQVNMIAAASA